MVEDRFSFRWGIPWLDAGFLQVPNFFFKHYAELRVTKDEFLFLLHLAVYRFESPQGYSCPSLGTIAVQMGISRRQVRRLRESLEKEGWLKVHRRAGETSLYDFQAFALAMMRLEEIASRPGRPGQGPGGRTPVSGVPRTPMSEGVGHPRPGGSDMGVRGLGHPRPPNNKQETQKKREEEDPDPSSRIPIWELGGQLQDIGINQDHGIALIEKYGVERIQEVLTAVAAQGEKVRGRAAWVVAALRKRFIFSAPGVSA